MIQHSRCITNHFSNASDVAEAETYIRLQQAAQAAIQQHVLPFYRDFFKVL